MCIAFSTIVTICAIGVAALKPIRIPEAIITIVQPVEEPVVVNYSPWEWREQVTTIAYDYEPLLSEAHEVQTLVRYYQNHVSRAADPRLYTQLLQHHAG